MNPHRFTLLCLAAAVAVSITPSRAQAAEAYDNCKGYLAAVPAVINTAGTWCMNKDLNSALASGAAVTVSVPNVIIDCNGFKLVGLSAGVATQAIGVASANRNTTVRNCDVRGFRYGTAITAINTVIEDSRFDANRTAGIFGEGDGFTIRRNIITKSGGTPFEFGGYGIQQSGTGDVIDNTIVGVTNAENEGFSYGINLYGNHGGSVRHNRIRDLTAPDIGQGAAIYIDGDSEGVAIQDNVIHVGPDDYFSGINCISDEAGVARGNTIQGVPYVGINGCVDGGANYVATTGL